jgi:transcriptional regulator with XRE-family HTH domain
MAQTMNTIALGEGIRNQRKKHNLKAIQLADDIGTTSSYISEIESGKKTPSITTLLKIAERFDISLDVLVRGAETSSYNRNLAIGEITKKLEKLTDRQLELVENVIKSTLKLL